MPVETRSQWDAIVYLVPRNASSAEDRARIGTDAMRLGRDPACEVVVKDSTVSRRHARLFWNGAELMVEDLGSLGGTYLNGAKTTRSVVAPGDVIRLGPRCEYVISSEPTTTAIQVAAQRGGGEEGVKYLQVLLDVARALNAATVLEEVLDVVLQAAVRLVKADQGCVVMAGSEGKQSALRLYPSDLGENWFGEKSSLVERALKERRTVVAQAIENPNLSMVGRGVQTAVATPLLVTHRPLGSAQEASFIATVEAIGAILLERKSGALSFSRDELGVFESLAADAAVAIDSARLYRESREKAKIEHEMALARTIQAAMLQVPPKVAFADVFASSHSARIVGGDLYFSTLRADGSMAIAVGDVSGKGIAAALIMAMAQGLLELLNDLKQPLEAVLHGLDRALLRHNPGNRFLTLAIALIHPDGTLEVANAGHCPVLIGRADGSIERIDPGGPIVGLLPSAAWTSELRRLAPGDLIVLYSDGIAESFSPGGEEFGPARTEATVAKLARRDPETVAQAILDAAAAHREYAEADDDVTILVARYSG